MGGGHQIQGEVTGTQVAENAVPCPSSLDKPGCGTCISFVGMYVHVTCAWLHVYMCVDVHTCMCTYVCVHVHACEEDRDDEKGWELSVVEKLMWGWGCGY